MLRYKHMATYQTFVQPEIKTNNVAVQPIQRAEFVTASKEFVLWLHKNLCYPDIKKSLAVINRISVVDLGCMYKAWRNNQQIPVDLKKRYESKSKTLKCSTCDLALSNAEIRRSLIATPIHISNTADDCNVYCSCHVPLIRPNQHDNKTGIFSIITNDGKADRLLNETTELERIAQNSRIVIAMSNNHVGPIVVSSAQFMHIKRNTRGISDLVEILGDNVVIREQARLYTSCMYCGKTCGFDLNKGFHIKMCYECYYHRESQFVK
jgi:hypothetical protein